jgi:radical SAM superfamily enzyme YgiQ (UPF0313 family)
MSSLGCPFSCTYCCNNILHKLVKEKQYIVRRRSVHNVIEELTQAKKLYNFSFVEFWDDVFTMDHKWLKIFSNEYKNKINIPFFCYAHASSINEDIIDELHRAGLVRMTLGVQTGSDKCRKEYYNRVDTNTKILEAANLLRKYHIFVSYDFMIGNPAETDQEMKETFYFILKLPHPLALTVSPLLFFSKHDLTNTLLEKRLISKNDVEDVAYKALQGFGGLIHIHGSKKLKYWNFLYFLAGYIKLPIFLKNIVLSNWFYTISEWIIYPSHYILQLLIYLQLYLQQKYPNIFKSRAVK